MSRSRQKFVRLGLLAIALLVGVYYAHYLTSGAYTLDRALADLRDRRYVEARILLVANGPKDKPFLETQAALLALAKANTLIDERPNGSEGNSRVEWLRYDALKEHLIPISGFLRNQPESRYAADVRSLTEPVIGHYVEGELANSIVDARRKIEETLPAGPLREKALSGYQGHLAVLAQTPFDQSKTFRGWLAENASLSIAIKACGQKGGGPPYADLIAYGSAAESRNIALSENLPGLGLAVDHMNLTPRSIAGIRYVACMDQTREELEPCLYGSVGRVMGYAIANSNTRFVVRRRAQLKIAIRELRSGVELARARFSGASPGECPVKQEFEGGYGLVYLDGEDVDSKPVAEWLQAQAAKH